MRQIKFRVWGKSEKMIPSSELCGLHASTIFQCVEGYHVMQYTGLKDRKGKEVYEGDVIRVYDIYKVCICDEWEDCDSSADGSCEEHGEHKHESIYDCENFLCTQEVKWKRDGGYYCDEDNGNYCPLLGADEIELEIIGNIYENPELLDAPRDA